MDHHVINGQSKLSISTIPEAQNHLIIGLLSLPFFSDVLIESPLWCLLVLEDLLFFDDDVHPFNSSFIISTQLLLLHLGIPISSSLLLIPFISSFIISNVAFPPTLTYFNLFLFTNYSFQFLIYNINTLFYPTLTHSNLFLVVPACFDSMWHFCIKF